MALEDGEPETWTFPTAPPVVTGCYGCSSEKKTVHLIDVDVKLKYTIEIQNRSMLLYSSHTSGDKEIHTD